MLRNKLKTIIALIILIIFSVIGLLHFNGIIQINFQTNEEQINSILSSALASTVSNSFEDSISILNDGLRKFPDNKKIIEMKIFNYYIMNDIQNANILCESLIKQDLSIEDKKFLLKYAIFTNNENLRLRFTNELDNAEDKTQDIYYLLGYSYLVSGNVDKMHLNFQLSYDNSTYLDKYNSKYYISNGKFDKIYELLNNEWNDSGFTIDMFFNVKSLNSSEFIKYMEIKSENDTETFNKLILATLYYETEAYEDAIALIEELPFMDDNIPYNLLLSSLYDKLNQLDKAQKLKGEVIAINHNNPFIHYILGKDAILNNDYGKALNEGISALGLKSNYLNVYFDIFYNCYNAQNDGANKKISLIQSLFYDPFNAEVYNLLGIQYFNENDFEKSIKNFKYASNLDDSVAIYFSNLAKACSENGETENSISALQESLKLEDNNAVLDDLSFEYIKIHDFKSAFDSLTELCKKNPTEQKYKYKLGVVNCYLKKYNEALNLFEKIDSPIADSLYYKSNLISTKFFLSKIEKKEAIEEISMLLNSDDASTDLKNALKQNLESINSSSKVVTLIFFYNY